MTSVKARQFAVFDSVAQQRRGRPRYHAPWRSSSGKVGLPSRKVVTDILAELRSRAFVVEQIIDQLKRGSRMSGRIAAHDSSRSSARTPASTAPMTRAGLEQASRSCSGSRAGSRSTEISGSCMFISCKHLAFGDHVCRIGQHLEYTHAIDRHHHLEGPRVDEIANQHARGVAEQAHLPSDRPRRKADSSTTSSCSSVAVWMNSTVAAKFVALRPGKSQCVCETEQNQQGTDALAAGADDVVRNAGRSLPRPMRVRALNHGVDLLACLRAIKTACRLELCDVVRMRKGGHTKLKGRTLGSYKIVAPDYRARVARGAVLAVSINRPSLW